MKNIILSESVAKSMGVLVESNEYLTQLAELIDTGEYDNLVLAYEIAQSQGSELAAKLDKYVKDGYGELIKSSEDVQGNISRDIGDLFNAETIDLEMMNLTKLPPKIVNLHNLKYLYLSSNHLTSLPNGFGKLGSLLDLDISDNDFETFPMEIAQLPKLTYLAIDKDLQSSIPQSMMDDKKLKIEFT